MALPRQAQLPLAGGCAVPLGGLIGLVWWWRRRERSPWRMRRLRIGLVIFALAILVLGTAWRTRVAVEAIHACRAPPGASANTSARPMDVVLAAEKAATWSGPDETVDLVGRIAGDVGCAPARVAIAWLAARRGNIIPLLGATSVGQLDENLAAADVHLDDDQLRQLDKVSAPTLGFPPDLLQRDNVTNGTYGDQWRLVDDRGRKHRRRTYL